MSLFKRDFNKPGPGVPKNAPRKKGIPRFFEVLGRDFGNLVKLNVIFALCVLPAQVLFVLCAIGLLSGVTWQFALFGVLALAASVVVGPAQTAVSYLITKMLRDDPGFVWHDFKKIFRENFRPAALPGVLYALILASEVFTLFYFLSAGGEIPFAFLVIYLFSVLLFSMAAPYYFLQQAYVNLGPAALLKNSLLLAVGNLPRSFMGALLGTGLLVVQFNYIFFAAVILLVIGYTLPALLCMMWVWPVADKTFHIEETLRQRSRQGDEAAEAPQTDGEPS